MKLLQADGRLQDSYSLVAEVMVPNEVQVVDAATLPEKPIKPRKLLTMVIGILLGAIVGTGVVVAKSLFNRKIKTTDDVENILGLPVIGIIPEASAADRPYQHRSVLQKWRDKLWKK